MSLPDRLSEDLKQAMKAKDQLRVDVVRMIKAALLNKELELKKSLDDAEMSRVMTTLIKQRKEAVEHYQKAKRDDLAGKELREITIIPGKEPISQRRPLDAIDEDTVNSQKAADANSCLIGHHSTHLETLLDKNRGQIEPLHDSEGGPLRLELKRRALQASIGLHQFPTIGFGVEHRQTFHIERHKERRRNRIPG